MQYTQFRVQERINDYIQNLKTVDSLNVRFIINALGWWISFFLTFSAFESGNLFYILWLIINFYFWFAFNKDLLKKIVPPVEILLVIILVLAVIDFTILNSSDSLMNAHNFSIFSGWTFWGIVHKFFLSFLVLFFGLLLIVNNKGKQRVLILYSVFLLIGHYGFFYGHISYLILFQFFLFFSLMKRTTWLERLTRLELIIYFAMILWFFLIITEPSFVKVIRAASDENQTITYSLPYFIYLLINLYLLALLIRIPIVVIYNHAGLSRKLRIAGLFQSSFPLFIQMAALLIIFFLFISGWQAEQLRDQFIQIKDKGLTVHRFAIDSDGKNQMIDIPGYQTEKIDEEITGRGIISLRRLNPEPDRRKVDYFFFQKSVINNRPSLQLTEINKEFLNQVASKLKLLAGNGIVAYTHQPRRWTQYFSWFGFTQSENEISTNPFALIYPLAGEAGYGADRIMCVFPGNENNYNNWSLDLRLFNLKNPLIVVGRLTIPLYYAENPEHSSFLIDIYFDLRSFFQWNFMTQILLGLIILFIIFNMLIIRRVVAFGAQINASVVQKFDELKKGIREVSSGNLEYKVELEGEDEFVELAGRFNQMGVRLQKTIEEAREKDRLDQELKIARQVQLSLLKKELPQIKGYSVAADLQTATEVGGDFYDIIQMDEERFIFSIGDVSGKGSSAAFYMAQFMSLLRYSPSFMKDPKEIAFRLNEYMMNQVTDRQIFITAIIGILNSKTNEIQFIRAGHNLPVHISNTSKNPIKELNPSGLGIGLSNSGDLFTKSLKLYKFRIKAGEKFFMYTDGIVEARRPNTSIEGEKNYEIYGEERLNLLLTKCMEMNARELITAITNDLDDFYGDHPRIDDFTLMIIEKEN